VSRGGTTSSSSGEAPYSGQSSPCSSQVSKYASGMLRSVILSKAIITVPCSCSKLTTRPCQPLMSTSKSESFTPALKRTESPLERVAIILLLGLTRYGWSRKRRLCGTRQATHEETRREG